MKLSKIIRLKIPFSNRLLAIKILAWNQYINTYYGITNETHDGYYIPFWDFKENIDVDDVCETLNAIQEDKNLGTVYIIQTYPNESYRAFGFDCMDWQYYISTLAFTDYIDWSYLKHSVMRGRAVIRISDKDGTKNKLVRLLKSRGLWRISLDHQAFFSKLFPQIPFPDIEGKVRVRLSRYESFR